MEEHISSIGKILSNQNLNLKERFRALFTLRNLGGEASIKCIAACFSDPSALLKHELAYCLGQIADSKAIPYLIHVLEDTSQEPMVRHEAGEALGAIGDPSVKDILLKYSNDPVVEVSETCQLAYTRIKWLENPDIYLNNATVYKTIDPAPPSDYCDIEKLQNILMNKELSLFERYRAIFSLRNINTSESAKALAVGFQDSSALFRHEIGYVLGQMACDVVVKELCNVVENKNESDMVRHEAAEALGAIANKDSIEFLKKYLNDDVRVVRESCEIALDVSDYATSKDFQYADALLKI